MCLGVVSSLRLRSRRRANPQRGLKINSGSKRQAVCFSLSNRSDCFWGATDGSGDSKGVLFLESRLCVCLRTASG